MKNRTKVEIYSPKINHTNPVNSIAVQIHLTF